jgi:hypothetical protein
VLDILRAYIDHIGIVLKIVVGTHGEERSLVEEDNIKMDLKDMG